MEKSLALVKCPGVDKKLCNVHSWAMYIVYSKARQCEWQKFALVKCPGVDKKMGKVNFERKKTLPKSDLGCLPRGLHLSGAFQGNYRCISGGF